MLHVISHKTSHQHVFTVDQLIIALLIQAKLFISIIGIEIIQLLYRFWYWLKLAERRQLLVVAPLQLSHDVSVPSVPAHAEPQLQISRQVFDHCPGAGRAPHVAQLGHNKLGLTVELWEGAILAWYSHEEQSVLM